ncbi:MAG: hypothetical protein ACO3RY_06960, partial [Opitutales bacterium]
DGIQIFDIKAQIQNNASRELRLDHSDKLGINPGSKTKPVQVGGNWKGPPPEFRNLRWID